MSAQLAARPASPEKTGMAGQTYYIKGLNMAILLLIIFLLGLPRSLVFIPAFIVIWYTNGASSGSGQDTMRILVPLAYIIFCGWGIIKNFQKYILNAHSKKDLTQKTEASNKNSNQNPK